MSFSKCFYCECKLGDGKDDRPEVDHHVEVAENRELAFEWTNLCLSCHGCNSKKLNNAQIPVSECLNPCSPSDKPADHLTFDDELIRPKNGSVKGSNTIKKYKLNREQLDYLRVRQIKNFERALRKLRERQVRDGRKELSKDEKEILESFKQPHHAFSLMFKVYLTHLDL